MLTLHHTTLDDIQRQDVKRNRPTRVACNSTQYGEYLQLKNILDKSYHADLQMAYIVLGDSTMMEHFKQYL